MAKLLKIKTGVDTTTDDIVVKKAKQLETARLINGVPFDGTQDIILEPGTSENADKVDGYHADTANVAETVVVRDTNKNINVTSVSADWFDLNTTTEFLGIQETPGRIFFDETHDTLAIVTNSGNKIEVGEDLYLPLANNNSGVSIPNGYLVMATGANGDKLNIARAVTDGTIEGHFIIGVATVDIPIDSENGRVTTQGYIKNVNTDAWNVGTLLYPDPTIPGWWTSTKPESPAINIPLAIVIKKNSASGILLVRMGNYSLGTGSGGYAHPTGFISQPENSLTGANVISQVTVNGEGHVTGVSTRALTPSDIGAASTTDLSTLSGVVDTKLTANDIVTGATKTKITYDAKGLVTAGGDLAESDIPMLPISKITNLQTNLGEKAIIVDYSITLPSTGWLGSGPYTIDVTANLTTITETDKPIIDLDMASVAFEDIDAVNTEWGKVYRAVTYNGGITFYAKEAITQSLQLKVRVVK